MRAAAAIVHVAVTAVEIADAEGVPAAEVGVAAVAVGVREAAVVVETAVVAGVPEAGVAEGGTKFRCHDFVATDIHGSARINQRELNGEGRCESCGPFLLPTRIFRHRDAENKQDS